MTSLPNTLLLVEPDQQQANKITEGLTSNGFAVSWAQDVHGAVDAVRGHSFDLVVANFDIASANAIELCRLLRSRGQIPVVVFANGIEPGNVIATLEAGADKVVSEGCSPAELAARIRALLRRAGNEERHQAVVGVGDIEIDTASMQVRKAGRRLCLTPGELDVLLQLAKSPGCIVSKETLYDKLWGYDSGENGTALRTTIKRLRRKLEDDPRQPQVVLTARGIGYYLAPPSKRP